MAPSYVEHAHLVSNGHDLACHLRTHPNATAFEVGPCANWASLAAEIAKTKIPVRMSDGKTEPDQKELDPNSKSCTKLWPLRMPQIAHTLDPSITGYEIA
jgi:hypothetical protein